MKRSFATKLFPQILCAWLIGNTYLALAQTQTWKINVTNVDIKQFITEVAKITDKTFVVDPRIKGNVTVISTANLDQDGVYALFLSVLRVHNAGASPAGDVIRIVQNTVVKQGATSERALTEVLPEEIVTHVISAQNVDAQELVKILRPLIPQYGHVAAVTNPNVLIVSDHADNIRRLIRIIEQIDVANEEEFIVRPLTHARVGSVVAILEKVAPEEIGRSATGSQSIRIIANERNNTLILRGQPLPVAGVLKLIDKLDLPATATGATKVIYLSHANAANVADLLNGLSAIKVSGVDGTAPQETIIQADEALNAIVIRSNPSAMQEIIDIVAKLDVRRTQVLIEAAIAEISIDDLFAVGIEAAAVDASGSSVPAMTTTLNGIIGALLAGADNPNPYQIDPISLVNSATSPTLSVAKLDPDSISFGAVLNALATNSAADLLSAPSVTTLDNEEANLLVGQEVPFRTGSFTTTTDGASNPFMTIQRENVGIELTVTPHIHDGSSVRLEIHQVVENVIDSGLTIGHAGASDLITNKRELKTTVLAEDKQTIVLGGLIQDDIREVRKKVPILGDIPLLGYLFRSKSTTRAKRNLLLFLRPTVLRTEDDVKRTAERMYNQIWEVRIESRSENPSVDSVFEGRP